VRQGLIAAFVALAAAAAASAAPAPTALEHWTAFQGGRPAAGVHVDQRGSGVCTEASGADPRADAWRCLDGTQVEDPCFAGSAAFVLCPFGTPDSHDALELRLTRPLPATRAAGIVPATRGNPWVIVTTGGDYCYRAPRPEPTEAGRRVTYVCAGSAFLAGSPDQAHRVWTIALIPDGAAKRYVATSIAAAWW
jgi:hypothetical protein